MNVPEKANCCFMGILSNREYLCFEIISKGNTRESCALRGILFCFFIMMGKSIDRNHFILYQRSSHALGVMMIFALREVQIHRN